MINTIRYIPLFGTLLITILPAALQADQYRNYGMDQPRHLIDESMRRAGRGMGYRSVMPSYYYQPRRDMDFTETSRLIDQLVARNQRNLPPAPYVQHGFIPTLPGDELTRRSRTLTGDQLDRIYGPDGANEKSVRLITEYRLHVTGNPRLILGKISEDENTVQVDIVTKNGELVERYEINRKTGLWKAIH